MIILDMLRKIVFFLILPILSLLLATFFIEVGFELRQKIDTPSHPRTSSDKEVLFIGDSILGFLADEYSLATEIKKKFGQASHETYRFQEISRPALRTSQVLEKIPGILKEASPPDIIVLMVGKSDFIDPSFPLWTSLSRFRLFRLLEYGYWDIKNRIFRQRQPRLQEVNDLAQSAWDFYAKKNYKDAIPRFEYALRRQHPSSRVVNGLMSCYIVENKFSEGLRFFEEIRDTHPQKQLIISSIAILRSHPQNQQRQEAPLLNREFTAESRPQLRFQLWTYQIQNRAEEMFTAYRNSPKKISAPINSYTRNNLVDILNQLSHTSAQIFIMQYPLDHLSALSEVLPPLSPRVHFIDLRSFLLQAPSKEFASFWQEDIEHLSPKGNAWLAEKITPLLLETRKEP